MYILFKGMHLYSKPAGQSFSDNITSTFDYIYAFGNMTLF